MQPLLKAKEESECVERVCCPAYRAFTMDFKDGAGATFFSLRWGGTNNKIMLLPRDEAAPDMMSGPRSLSAQREILERALTVATSKSFQGHRVSIYSRSTVYASRHVIHHIV